MFYSSETTQWPSCRKEKQEVAEPSFTMQLLQTAQYNSQSEPSECEECEYILRKEINILKAVNPDLIYVTVVEATENLHYLKNSMLMYYANSPLKRSNWNISDTCVVFDKNRKHFARATVLDVTEESCKVLLFDYGVEIDVVKSEIGILEEQFTRYPDFAIKCHLANIKPAGDSSKWSLMSNDFLNLICSKNHKFYFSKVGSIDLVKKSLPVTIWYTEFIQGGPLEVSRHKLHNINNLLIEKGVALKIKNKEITKSYETIHQENAAESFKTILNFNNKKAFVDWLPPTPIRKTKFTALGTFVDDKGHIYIQDLAIKPALQEMELRMKKIFDLTAEDSLYEVWKVGDLCTVKYYLNHHWYRGKILKIGDNEEITVLMVDYGNEEVCTRKQLRKKIMFTDIQVFANKIALYGYEHQSWITSELDFIHSQVVEKKMCVSIKANKGTTIPSATVYVDSINLNELLLTRVSKIETITSDEDDAYIESEDNPQCVFPSSSASSLQCFKKYAQIPVLTETETKLNVIVVNILSPIKIIFKLYNNGGSDIDYILRDVTETAHLQPVLYDLQIEQACVTKSLEDMQWYRAQIINLNELERGFVAVWFVDTGIFESVPRQLVRMPKQSWLEFPMNQYIAKLHGIKIKNEENAMDVKRSMQRLYNFVGKARIINIEPLSIELYHNHTDTLAYQDLIDQGLLVLEN